MDLSLTPTQADIRAAARRYLDDRCPPSRPAEHAAELWPELVRTGWLDPDLGAVELVLLAEESGRALLPAPWWATTRAVPVYRAAGAELPGPVTSVDGTGSCVVRDGRLHGRCNAVVDARTCAEIVVAADTGDGVALFGVRPDAPGVTLTDRPGPDLLRTAADLVLTDVVGRLLLGPPAAAPVLAEVTRRSALLAAAEGVGVATRALEFAAEHARTRVQFGRPIGAFQAVGHALAECYADVEAARSLVYRAACAPDLPDAAHCATWSAARAAARCGETAIQVCGGMGVTWEFPLHRWYRRALWLEARVAAGPDPVDAIAAALLGPETVEGTP
ncbi:acyl-CoA dehydrogenase family protein [Saccharothrix obliqua]|uniref:acyl-CoA dehydrogenase family protein n=1 Tax=Saccharothrix obliqua TaxID=2861747 RepID=UPI001C5EDD39|nr:acyl-CoA dehydrogenase [Saccharothrix obliqua]MBW4721842.1 acyl-CoA dehydrogenase [Saccharothrix obliqua]